METALEADGDAGCRVEAGTCVGGGVGGGVGAGELRDIGKLRCH